MTRFRESKSSCDEPARFGTLGYEQVVEQER